MVRSAKRVSNHEATDGPASFETPLSRLLRMRVVQLAMAEKHTFSFPRQLFARVVPVRCPSRERGRRESRAQTAPVASFADRRKQTSVVTTGSANSHRLS